MATTTFGSADALTRKAWSKGLAVEGIQKTYAKKFMGKEGENALFIRKTELKKGKGDQITCGLSVELTGDGVGGDTVLTGKEESLGFHNQIVKIDQLRHGVKNLEGMTQQRTDFALRKVGKSRLSSWFAKRTDVVLFNQLCGNTAATSTIYTGSNAATAPTSARHLIADGVSDEETIGSSNKFNLEMIDYAVEKAKTATIEAGTGSPITPIMMDGKECYVAFLHPYQVTDLRTASGSRWKEIHDAMLAASASGKNNPILTGALGIYNNTILHESSYVTTGCNSSTPTTAISTVRRAVFCGAGAAIIAEGGQEGGATSYSWSEETEDHGNQYSIGASRIWGVKKSVYTPTSGTAQDHGAIVMASYAAPHTGA